MANSFDSYIKQLQELEQNDNRSTLYSFCTLNGPVLSYFRGIWDPLQTIIQSSNIDLGIINDIKPVLAQLSSIKKTYESLKSKAHEGFEEDVCQFQEQIDSTDLYNCGSVAGQIEALQFCIENEQVLSYFQGIRSNLQALRKSSLLDINVINKIKPVLTLLTDIKDCYESIKSNMSQACEDEILQFQEKIDSVTLSSISQNNTPKLRSLDKALTSLHNKNLATLSGDANESPRSVGDANDSPSLVSGSHEWADVKDRILRGEILSAKDLSLAEEHVSEGATAFFFRSLASKTKKGSVLDKVYTSALALKMPTDMWLDLLWILVLTDIPFDNQEKAVMTLLSRVPDRASLKKLWPYCTTKGTISLYSSQLADRERDRKIAAILLALISTGIVIAVFLCCW